MKKKNEIYWAYNLPLQVWPKNADEHDDSSPIIGCTILNYMPRKQSVAMMDLEEELTEQTRRAFFLKAAKQLRNLAKLMVRAAGDPKFVVYYPGADPDEDQNT